MYIYFDNNIYFFENNIDHQILFLTIQKKNPTMAPDEINSIINLYNAMTKNKCKYTNNIENMVLKYIN